MGYCPTPKPEMGEFSTEIRRESFYIRGPMEAYAGDGPGIGTVEINTADIPKIRAVLDQVERHQRGERE